MKVIWSPLAIKRISDIAEYIANDSPATAEKWINNIFEQVKNLENFPQFGRVVPEANRQEIREIISGNYRIIYRLEGEEAQVSVLTVRHGSQILPEEDLK